MLNRGRGYIKTDPCGVRSPSGSQPKTSENGLHTPALLGPHFRRDGARRDARGRAASTRTAAEAPEEDLQHDCAVLRDALDGQDGGIQRGAAEDVSARIDHGGGGVPHVPADIREVFVALDVLDTTFFSMYVKWLC